jgi:putative protein-disulfide isomerase
LKDKRMHFVYVADPMCSWCYGFAPQLAQLMDTMPADGVELVMGGLRAGNRVPMEPGRRAELRGYWQRVHEASGQPFTDDDAMARPGFTYDTEPACRAVVAVRSFAPERAHATLNAVHAAFYRDGRDTTDAAVLADIAAETGLDRDVFVRQFASDAVQQQTQDDFIQVQRWGIGGFPTLLVAIGDELHVVSSGYADADRLRARLELIAQRAGAAGAR